MKKIYNLLFVLGLPAFFLLLTSGVLFHSGSQGNLTGSPGDNGENCTNCHTGTPMNQEFAIIGSELIVLGYSPGETYNILVTGHDANASKFGFEATAEDNAGNKVGSFTADLTGFTQTISGNKAITHTALGSNPIADTLTFWAFTWTAPATNVGDITFYTAINAANGNSATSGDQIYLSQSTYSYSTVGIEDNIASNKISVYPNPSKGIINIDNIPKNSNQMRILNLVGQVVYSEDIDKDFTKFDLSEFEKGVYFVNIGNTTQRIILN